MICCKEWICGDGTHYLWDLPVRLYISDHAILESGWYDLLGGWEKTAIAAKTKPRGMPTAPCVA